MRRHRLTTLLCEYLFTNVPELEEELASYYNASQNAASKVCLIDKGGVSSSLLVAIGCKRLHRTVMHRVLYAFHAGTFG